MIKIGETYIKEENIIALIPIDPAPNEFGGSPYPAISVIAQGVPQGIIIDFRTEAERDRELRDAVALLDEMAEQFKRYHNGERR